jgi:HSP20 family protein
MYSSATSGYHTALTSDDASTLSFDPSSSWTPEAIPQLTIDMYHKGDYIFVVSTVAGVTPGDLDISVESNVLFIKGTRRKPYNDGDVHTEINECFWGAFYREIPLQDTANTEQIEASLANGILTVKIPVIRSKAKKIQIRVS